MAPLLILMFPLSEKLRIATAATYRCPHLSRHLLSLVLQVLITLSVLRCTTTCWEEVKSANWVEVILFFFFRYNTERVKQDRSSTSQLRTTAHYYTIVQCCATMASSSLWEIFWMWAPSEVCCGSDLPKLDSGTFLGPLLQRSPIILLTLSLPSIKGILGQYCNLQGVCCLFWLLLLLHFFQPTTYLELNAWW